MQFRIVILFVVVLFIGHPVFGQHDGLSTTVNLSYSGLSQSLRYERTLGDFTLHLGPKVNFSKARTAFSNKPGLSFQTDYHPDCKGKFFLLYEFLPQKVDGGKSNIHEAYTGYGFRKTFLENWQINSGIGIGFYVETGNLIKSYRIQGLAYCSNLGLSYRF